MLVHVSVARRRHPRSIRGKNPAKSPLVGGCNASVLSATGPFITRSIRCQARGAAPEISAEPRQPPDTGRQLPATLGTIAPVPRPPTAAQIDSQRPKRQGRDLVGPAGGAPSSRFITADKSEGIGTSGQGGSAACVWDR